MTNDKFTIKLPRESGEKHNRRRQELGVTWEEYIDGQAPAMFSDLAEQLDRIEATVSGDADDVRAAAKAGARAAIEEVQR